MLYSAFLATQRQKPGKDGSKRCFPCNKLKYKYYNFNALNLIFIFLLSPSSC